MVSMPVSQTGACKETMDRLVSRLSLRRVATSGKAACPRLLGDGERALFTWQGSGWSQGRLRERVAGTEILRLQLARLLGTAHTCQTTPVNQVRERGRERERERDREKKQESETERERERERKRERERERESERE